MNRDIIKAAEILLPKEDIDLKKWSVVACDQYTAAKKYWESLKEYIGSEPSALNLVLPEVYLNDNLDNRIKKINETMKDYLDAGILRNVGTGAVLINRKTPISNKRLGLIVSVDLECYSYKKNEKPLIRCTEGTILDRIPPRVKIRENASLELPHIMLLIDDENEEIIETLYENRDKLKKLYDFELNGDGGNIEGYFVEDCEKTFEKIYDLIEHSRLLNKYGVADELLFAAGDGNHSLATAKKCFENLKATIGVEKAMEHPSRYALVEVVNIYSEGLTFEPIHRLLLNVDAENFVKEYENVAYGKSSLTMMYNGKEIKVKTPTSTAQSFSFLQAFIDEYLLNNGGVCDYVHGIDDIKENLKQENTLGILTNPLKKSELFKEIINNGALARKTFSMGEANEKRYYLETRRIK